MFKKSLIKILMNAKIGFINLQTYKSNLYETLYFNIFSKVSIISIFEIKI